MVGKVQVFQSETHYFHVHRFSVRIVFVMALIERNAIQILAKSSHRCSSSTIYLFNAARKQIVEQTDGSLNGQSQTD